jgi:hypothetical protein
MRPVPPSRCSVGRYGLTLEDAVFHTELNLKDHARPSQQWKDEHGQKPPQAATNRCRVGSHTAPPAGNAYAKQIEQQDHPDDVDRTDN